MRRCMLGNKPGGDGGVKNGFQVSPEAGGRY